jgi:hypothetical protein
LAFVTKNQPAGQPVGAGVGVRVMSHSQKLEPAWLLYLPLAHRAHAIAPKLAWYLDTGHTKQNVIPTRGWNLPISQSKHSPVHTRRDKRTQLYNQGMVQEHKSINQGMVQEHKSINH